MCPPDSNDAANRLKWPDDFITLAARASGGVAPSVTYDVFLRKLAELVVLAEALRRQGGFDAPERPAEVTGKG